MLSAAGWVHQLLNIIQVLIQVSLLMHLTISVIQRKNFLLNSVLIFKDTCLILSYCPEQEEYKRALVCGVLQILFKS